METGQYSLLGILAKTHFISSLFILNHITLRLEPPGAFQCGDCLPGLVAQPWPIEPYAEDHGRVSATGVCRSFSSAA